MRSILNFKSLCALAILSLVTRSAALTVVYVEPQSITELSDLWVQAKIVQSNITYSNTNPYGDKFYRVALTLKILDSTQPVESKMISIEAESQFVADLKVGRNGFFPLTVASGRYAPTSLNSHQSPTYAPSEETFDNYFFGPVPIELYWQWLKDVDNAIQSRGRVPEATLDRWTRQLSTDDHGVARLALGFLRTCTPLEIDAELLADGYISIQSDRNAPPWIAESQFRNFCKILGRLEDEEAALLALLNILDAKNSPIYDDYVSSQKKRAASGFLSDIDSPDLQTRIPEIIRDVLEKSRSHWLDLPPLHSLSNDDEAMPAAEPRPTRLSKWVDLVRRGDTTALRQLDREALPSDRFLVPELAKLSISQWKTNDSSRKSFYAARLMRRLASPEFLPTLVEWTSKEPETDLLGALIACGGEEIARDHVQSQLDQPLHARTDLGANENLVNRIGLLQLLGRIGGAHWEETLDNYSQRRFLSQLIRGSETNPSTESTLDRIRATAILATAHRKKEAAIPQLREFYKTDTESIRVTCALALYSLGDNTGAHYIDAIRSHARDIRGRILSPDSVPINGSAELRSAVDYLESPRLDQLAIERFSVDLEYQDHPLVASPGLFERLGPELIDILAKWIDDRHPTRRDVAITALQSHFKENFGYGIRSDPNDLYVDKKDAIEAWKSYVEDWLKTHTTTATATSGATRQ